MLVKSIHVSKYGMDAVMEPFISDLKKLVITNCNIIILLHMCLLVLCKRKELNLLFGGLKENSMVLLL